MFWKIYFWIFTPLSLILLVLNLTDDRGINLLNNLVVLGAIAALHAIAFNDFTIPKQLWKIVFWSILAGLIISLFFYRSSFTPLGLIINLPFLPIIYAIYKLAFKRKF